MRHLPAVDCRRAHCVGDDRRVHSCPRSTSCPRGGPPASRVAVCCKGILSLGRRQQREGREGSIPALGPLWHAGDPHYSTNAAMSKGSPTTYPQAVDRRVVNRVVRACVQGLGLVVRRRQDEEDAREDASYEMTQELWIASPDARRAMTVSFVLVLGLGAVLLCRTSSPDRCVRSSHTLRPSSGPSSLGSSAWWTGTA